MADDASRNPAVWKAAYLVGWWETMVRKKWSGDYNGGVGNSTFALLHR
jgi:hypothetical protein